MLPPHPRDATQNWTDIDHGIQLPLWHCAFSGCGDVFDDEKTWRYHFVEKHNDIFDKVCPKIPPQERRQEEKENKRETPKEKKERERDDLASWYMSWYVHAIRYLEQSSIPSHGLSIDRRTIQQTLAAYNDEKIQSLVCLCCGGIHTSWIGRTVVKSQVEKEKSNICMLHGSYLIEHIIGRGSARKWSFEDRVFRENYMDKISTLQRDATLKDGCWEWRQILQYSNGSRVPIICCPEDVQHCGSDSHEAHVICGECAAPLCSKCVLKLLNRVPVPMAIANHNFIGYCLDIIVDCRVRWIEAAAVCPAWTTLITFYMEEDRGHLMNEEQFGAKHRVGVRGNVFSLPMPWTDIMNSLMQAVESDSLTLPHPPHMLAHMVKLHLKSNLLEVTRHMKEIRVRTHVLLRLGYALIEALHPAFVKHTNAGDLLRADIHRIRAAYEDMVQKQYPEPENADDKERGVVPELVWQVVQNSVQAKQKESPIFEKNATPPPGAMPTDSVFDAAQPQMVVLERNTTAGTNAGELGQAALTKHGELEIQTGNEFINQFRAGYLQQAFPFDLYNTIGEIDYNPESRLRCEDAPMVDVHSFTTALPRRIERHIRSSWTLIPAIRNLSFRHNILHTASVAYKHEVDDADMLAQHAKEHTAAVAEIYGHMDRGYYTTKTGKKRPINNDLTKVYYAVGISEKAKVLLRNLMYVTSQQCGTQEVRKKIGNALLGARWIYGEPLFVTVSPSSRHSGLVLRLSRVRPNDPTLRLEDLALEKAQRLGSKTYPSVFQSQDTSLVDLPEYDVRQRWQARDGLCGIDAFRVWIMRVLPLLFGVRMCPFCPACNHNQDHTLQHSRCQDVFGSNMLAMGGFCGGADALGGAVEHQHDGNPHFHGHVHIVNVWQHSTVQEIAEGIRSKSIDPQLQESYVQWICEERHPDVQRHQKELPQLEAAWPQHRQAHGLTGLNT